MEDGVMDIDPQGGKHMLFCGIMYIIQPRISNKRFINNFYCLNFLVCSKKCSAFPKFITGNSVRGYIHIDI